MFHRCILSLLVILAAALTANRVSRGDEDQFPRPPRDAVAKAEEKIRDVYNGDLAKANRPNEKAALAKALMTAAGGVGQDDASRLVLLTMAKDLAVDANEASLAMKALTALVNRFQPDGPTDAKEQIERGQVGGKLELLARARVHRAVFNCGRGSLSGGEVDGAKLREPLPVGVALGEREKHHDEVAGP